MSCNLTRGCRRIVAGYVQTILSITIQPAEYSDVRVLVSLRNSRPDPRRVLTILPCAPACRSIRDGSFFRAGPNGQIPDRSQSPGEWILPGELYRWRAPLSRLVRPCRSQFSERAPSPASANVA